MYIEEKYKVPIEYNSRNASISSDDNRVNILCSVLLRLMKEGKFISHNTCDLCDREIGYFMEKEDIFLDINCACTHLPRLKIRRIFLEDFKRCLCCNLHFEVLIKTYKRFETEIMHEINRIYGE